MIEKHLRQNLIQFHGEQSIDLTYFADTIKNFLLDAKIATGMQVNPIISEIITPNPASITNEAKKALRNIRNIVSHTKHL